MPLKMHDDTQVPPLSRIKNIVAIAAGKGGVGKSSLTVNLALALQHIGYRVGIMDTDIYGPSVRKMLPEDRMPKQKGQMIIPALCRGIRMISMAYFRKEHEAAAVRAPIANGFIKQFITQVDWGELDYLLMDFPPGTGDVQLTLSQQANFNGAVMVTTPQDVATMDVRKAMNLFAQVKVPIIGIVENMSYYFHKKTQETLYLFGKNGGERLAREYGVPFLGQIPLDPELCEKGDRGESIFSAADGQTASAFLKLAEKLDKYIDTSIDDRLQNLVWKDDHTFTIEWNDGSTSNYRLSDLQKQCPCAACIDETTGKRMLDVSTIQDDVRAVQIENVGRYALRIQFTSGCSSGIYDFDLLRKIFS